MAYLEDEPTGERVADTIADAHDDDIHLRITVINAGGVWYIVAPRVSVTEADKAIQLLNEIVIELVEADWPLTNIAASFKVKAISHTPTGSQLRLRNTIKASLVLEMPNSRGK